MRLETTSINRIFIPHRYRENLGDLESLGASLDEIGQIQTIAVKEIHPEDTHLFQEGLEFELLAGGRRLLAMQARFEATHPIDVTVFPSDLSESEKLAIELCENIERKDFDWKEEAALKKRLHELLTKAQSYRRVESPSEREWTQEDTADALGVARSMVTEDIGIADAVEAMPELFEGVKSRKDALNLLARMIETMATEELAKRAMKEKESGTLGERRDKLINSYHCGDFFEWAKGQPPGTYDLVEFDPDYGVDFGFSHSAGSSAAIQQALIGNYQFVSREIKEYREYLEGALQECYRLAKDDAWLVLWFAQDPWFELVFSCAEKEGWNGKRLPAVWYKEVIGKAVGNPDRDLGRTHETFFYLYKGSPRINRRARGDVFSYPTTKTRIHPTEKPIPLMEDIYTTFCKPGSKILVPHLGSGNGITAANSVGMFAEGCDLDGKVRDSFIARVMKMKENDE